jgi:hypothetical protein
VGTIVGSIMAAIITAHIPTSGKKCVMELSRDILPAICLIEPISVDIFMLDVVFFDIFMSDNGSFDISMLEIEWLIDMRPSKSIFIDRLIE